MPIVLLIDDNKMLCLVEARYIQRAFANVDMLVSSNGCCVLEQISNQLPDVTILDTGLVEMDAMDVYHSLCEVVDPQTILITSSQPAPEFEELKYRGKIHDLLIRPFPIDYVTSCVEQILLRFGHTVIPYRSTFPPPSALATKQFDRHLALNQLSGILGAVRALEAEIDVDGKAPPYIKKLLEEYIPKIVAQVNDVSANIKLSKSREQLP